MGPIGLLDGFEALRSVSAKTDVPELVLANARAASWFFLMAYTGAESIAWAEELVFVGSTFSDLFRFESGANQNGSHPDLPWS